MSKLERTHMPSTAILHYSAPPVVGGVEGVIQAHCKVFVQQDYPVGVVAGRGDQRALPKGSTFHQIPEIDTQHPTVLEMAALLEKGTFPKNFETFSNQLVQDLAPILAQYGNVIIHNVLTKHFNIPLTHALIRLIDKGVIKNCIAWCHDFTWTSPNSRSKVHDGYPWDALRTYDPRIIYVTVSQERQKTLAQLFDQPETKIQVVYNGVDSQSLLGLSEKGYDLIQRLDVFNSELILLMPVRVTQAKNIEFALHLLASLKEKGVRPKLIHTGPPDPHDEKSMEYYHSLQALRSELGLEDEMRFVFESGPDPSQPYQVSLEIVGDLYRISDLMIMPSHREGFGMPVLEAGLAGIPAFSTSNVPAAIEIGKSDVTLFDASEDPVILADRLLTWMESNPQFRLKQKVRQQYTWEALFKRDILPLLRDQ